MVPDRISILDQELQVVSVPSKDFFIDFENGHIRGYVCDKNELKQAIALRLHTQSGIYDIYDAQYGLPIYRLNGSRSPLIYVDIKNRIRTTLCADDRILDVYDFLFTVCDGGLQVRFYVRTAEEILEGSVTI